MKSVVGYLAEDGKFFKTAAECKRHEARHIIEEYCKYNRISCIKMLETIEALADPIMDYINADNEVKQQEDYQVKENTSGPSGDQADD